MVSLLLVLTATALNSVAGPVRMATVDAPQGASASIVQVPLLAPGTAADAPDGTAALIASTSTVDVLWANQSGKINAVGAPSVDNGSLAFDPLLQEMVLFGGCGSVCPTNATWTYDAGSWSELPSGSVLPPRLAGSSLVWDPLWGGVVLSGGALPDGNVADVTWMFNGTGWQNLTASVGGSPAVAYGSMAYDGAMGEMVAVNGCTTTVGGCRGSLVGQTYVLGGPKSGWTDVTSTDSYPGEPTLSFGGALAYDPSLSELVYFGGQGATGTVLNATWTLTTGTWTNATSASVGCTTFVTPCPTSFYPAGVALGGATWDGQLHDLVLVGGFESSGAPTNATDLLSPNGAWYPLSARTSSTVLPTAGYGAALSSNSSAVAPLLVEGDCLTGVHCRGDAWVLEIPPAPLVSSASPDPAEVGVPVTITGTDTLDNGSGPTMTATLQDSAGHSNVTLITGVNFTSTLRYTLTTPYSAAGTVSVTATLEDFFDVSATSPKFSLPVNGTVTAAPVADRNPAEVGTASTFTANAADGVPPYSYVWGFGDGSGGSTLPIPSHPYASTGTFDAWVVVTDHLGATYNTSLSVTVYPALSAEVVTAGGPADAGVAVPFLGEVKGGSGTYTSYLWTFGDGGTASTLDATHTYSLSGTYEVTFTVADSAGFQASGVARVTIRPQLAASPIDASSTTPEVGSSVAFNLTVRNGSPAYDYSWTFGDGGQSTEASPSHTYEALGTFTVAVTVSDAAGATLSKKLTITVEKRKESIFGSLTQGTYLYALIGVAAAAAGLGAYFVTARRAKRRPPPERLSSGSGGVEPGAATPTEDGSPPE